MASSAEPPPPHHHPGGERDPLHRSRSTPVAAEFVYPSGVPTLPAVEKIGNRRDLTHGFHLDRCKHAMEDQYMEDIAFGADETDDEEKNENDDSLVLADYEGEDLPTIEWNREDPQLAKGTVFQTMMDCRNAITTYHILTKNNYEVIKSEPGRPRKNRIGASAEGGAPIRKCKRCGIPGHIARLCKNGVDPAFGMEDQREQNAEENEAAIQLEIEATVQHEEIEAANAEEIEAAVQHEEIEAANAEEIEAAV
ncbi:hypothetical protein QYE76_040819 [Lolium multiflorum]|uniref:CCHC-type domain-containing protein n=1 Tax=Lolium multiflorum TaxID=4521 RepID=A0AAD8TCK9_LOLMU|nr:hypothetical protein QYE76_040819 [Lolium multiflorum]